MKDFSYINAGFISCGKSTLTTDRGKYIVALIICLLNLMHLHEKLARSGLVLRRI